MNICFNNEVQILNLTFLDALEKLVQTQPVGLRQFL